MKEGGFTNSRKKNEDKNCDTSALSRLQKIYEMTDALMRPTDANDICMKIVDSLFNFFEKIDSCAIFAVDRNLGLKEVAVRSRSERRLEKVPFSQALIDRVLRTGTPMIIPHPHEEGGIASEMCIPLAGKVGVHGVVCLLTLDEGRAFQEEDLRFVAAMTIPAAFALENAHLHSMKRLAEEDLKKAREDLEKQISERIAELTQANRQLQELSITDELTGLYNHRHLVRTLESEFKRAVRYKRNFTLLMVDVDFFKQVNDAYGHPCGDLVLRELARVFKKTVRATDIVARYGGDELAVVLLETQKETALKISEKLRREVEKYPFKWEGESFQVTVSIGAASAFEKGIRNWDTLLNAADKALYQAKGGKRNIVVAFEPEPDTLQLDLFRKPEMRQKSED
jgi:diguanylate cyclase (GGDEF)-like protein